VGARSGTGDVVGTGGGENAIGGAEAELFVSVVTVVETKTAPKSSAQGGVQQSEKASDIPGASDKYSPGSILRPSKFKEMSRSIKSNAKSAFVKRESSMYRISLNSDSGSSTIRQ
jgi:hypothetical protein